MGREGTNACVADLIIAATALAHDLVLMTDKRKDLSMTQLVLYRLP
jgi:predicted nucleic acid-binding protein